MIIDVKDGIFEVNTSETYNKEIYFIDNNLIIPYINLEIFSTDLPSNKLKKYDKLDFSYLIFKDVKEIFWTYEFNDEAKRGKLFFNNTSLNNYLDEHIGGPNLFTENNGYEIEVRFKEQYLYFSEDVGIKNGPLSFWIPIDTPNFRKNMNEGDVQSFFNKNSIPADVLRIVGAANQSKLETLDLTKSQNTKL